MAEPTPTQDSDQEQRNAVEYTVSSKAYVENPELLPWYTTELQEPTPETRALFEKYSQLPSGDVVSHIKRVRDEAFKVVRARIKPR